MLSDFVNAFEENPVSPHLVALAAVRLIISTSS
jgi:hypothetical protein